MMPSEMECGRVYLLKLIGKSAMASFVGPFGEEWMLARLGWREPAKEPIPLEEKAGLVYAFHVLAGNAPWNRADRRFYKEETMGRFEISEVYGSDLPLYLHAYVSPEFVRMLKG